MGRRDRVHAMGCVRDDCFFRVRFDHSRTATHRQVLLGRHGVPGGTLPVGAMFALVATHPGGFLLIRHSVSGRPLRIREVLAVPENTERDLLRLR